MQGGSTITQQLARQSVGREKTLTPQAEGTAVRRAARASLHQGRNPRAVSEQGLFRRRPVRRRSGVARVLRQEGLGAVSLGEAALLAGLLKAPSSYAPTVSPEKAEARQGVVLRAMLDSKAITREEYDRALKTGRSRSTTACAPRNRTASTSRMKCAGSWSSGLAPSAWREGGLQVYTTIDLDDAARRGCRGRSERCAISRRRCRSARTARQASRCRRRWSRSIRATATCAPWSAAATFVKQLVQSRHAGEAPAGFGVQAVHLCRRGRRRLRPGRSDRRPRTSR